MVAYRSTQEKPYHSGLASVPEVPCLSTRNKTNLSTSPLAAEIPLTGDKIERQHLSWKATLRINGVNAFLRVELKRGEGRREHKNTVELENDLEMMRELNFTYLAALLGINGSTKGMVWMAGFRALRNLHRFPTLKHHKQSDDRTKKQSVCYANIASGQMSSSTPIWLFATQLPPFI